LYLLKNYNEARKQFEIASNLWSNLGEKHNNIKYKKNAADAISLVGACNLELNEREAATKAYKRCLNMYIDLTGIDPRKFQHVIVELQNMVKELEKSNGDYDENAL